MQRTVMYVKGGQYVAYDSESINHAVTVDNNHTVTKSTFLVHSRHKGARQSCFANARLATEDEGTSIPFVCQPGARSCHFAVSSQERLCPG
jgi:hypothetical protein